MSKLMIVSCCLSILLVGCGNPNKPFTPDQAEESTLTQVGGMYLAYQISKNKPPASLNDLNSVKAVSGNGYEAVRSGEVILRYGATLPDMKEEPGGSPSDEILAYQKQVPQSGGKVLMLNRTVKTMTADEFKAAKKAGKD